MITRRRFLTTSAIALAGTSAIALDRAPAFAQKRELTMLSFNHFVPASDDELRRQAELFSKQAGVTVRVDTIAGPQMFAKRAAEVSSQSGHDIIVTGAADPFLYEQHLVDVGDLVDSLGGRYGGWYAFAKDTCLTASGWRAVPWFWVAFVGQLQRGAVQEGRAPAAEDLGRPAEGGQDPQEAGQPDRHSDQPLHGRQHHLLVGAVVQRRQGAGEGRQDAGDQQRQGRPGRRVVQGALQGRHGARSALVGQRVQQPLPALGQGVVDPQPDQPLRRGRREEDADRRRDQPPQQPGGPAGIHSATGVNSRRDLEVLEEHPARQGLHQVPVPERELQRVHPAGQRVQPAARSRRSGSIPSGRATRSTRCFPRKASTCTSRAGPRSRTPRCS